MKKLLLLPFMLFLFTANAQEVVSEQPTSFWTSLLTNSDFINVLIPIFAFCFTGLFTWLVTKLRTAGKLLIAFADAIEDKNVDANERTDLAMKARAMFWGTAVTTTVTTTSTTIENKDNPKVISIKKTKKNEL